LLDTFEVSYPRYYKLKYKDDVPNVRNIQSSLDSKTTLIDYFFVDSALCIFTISKKSFNISVRNDAPKIIETASLLRRSLKTFDEGQYLKIGSLLFNMLFQPVERQINGDHIVIIPDGELYYIPFEALLTRPQKTGTTLDYSVLPYLVKKYAMSYSYSPTLFIRLRKDSRVSKDRSFIGFAPVFSDSVDNNHVLSANKIVGHSTDGMTTMRSISIDGKKFNELEYSKREIGGIAQLFHKNHLRQALYLYRDASKQNFKQFVHDYAFVHIASHGYTDEEHPNLSGILFSQPNDTLAEEDAILNTGETYGLNLDAELVVLSSCESGLGRFVKGEGLMAMTRGFFYSGARNIVFSLWKVPDKHTSDLMTAFYGFLLSGIDMPSAMRKAKLKMIADPLSAFPSKWTGFVLLSSN
jgi:CHAT domain-containing protein